MGLNTLYIRADASPVIGIGHIMRCIALGQAWQDMGWDVCFISCGLAPELEKKLTALNIRLCPVDAAWPAPEDLTQTLAGLPLSPFANDNPPSWVVLDGYHFDQKFQASIRATGHKVLVIDDANHLESYKADILVNQNLWGDRYPYKVPESCRILAGSRFIMLRKEFSDPACSQKPGTGDLKVMVTMGGADPGQLTKRILKILAGLDRPKLKIKVVIGPALSHLKDIKAAIPHGNSHIELLQNPDMARLMAWADLAVTAGGSTCWELCAMGVPFITFPMADNQTDIAQSLEDCIGAVNAGPPDQMSKEEMTQKIKAFIDNKDLRIANLSRELVDGKGAMRIVQAMTEQAMAGQAALQHPDYSPSSKFPSAGSKKITIVSDKTTWLNAFLPELIDAIRDLGHPVEWVHDLITLTPSDIVFYLSFGQIVPVEVLKKNTHNIVVHGSDLPKGRGWSPISWQILEGKNIIPITLFEASEKVDTGQIYLQRTMELQGTELIFDIRKTTARLTKEMCLTFLEDYDRLVASARMPEGKGTLYPRRTAQDSQLDPDKSIRDQFNLLRIVDNDNYPAFFTLKGKRFKLTITPMEDTPDAD